jgi:uncharacterized C2H2 Zn-finger protein
MISFLIANVCSRINVTLFLLHGINFCIPFVLLQLHSKTHEGEKCFKCDLCAYASISQRHLESHMLIHTDQKPYQCDQCDQCFRQKQLLRRHQNLYHNPDYVPPPPGEKRHECPECGKPFRHKGNLIRHLALHDPDAAQQELRAFRAARKQRIKGLFTAFFSFYGVFLIDSIDEN